MQLIPNKIPIKVGEKYIAVLNEHMAHNLDLHPGDRISVKNGRKGEIIAILDITEDRKEIRDTEVGLYIESWEKLRAKRGDKLCIKLAEKPISLQYIKDKLDGKKLNKEQINEIIKDVVHEDLSELEIAYFVSGCYTKKLDMEEAVNLTKAIVANGSQLKFNKKIVADKHCIGGVAGNRTTLIVVPIVTALGITMPKTSSRAITSPAGTADTMEVLANVLNDAAKLQKIADKVGGFITWGGGVDLASADDKMIQARHILSLDPEGMLLASIMAKKHSVGATHVLIDIPYGPQVKMATKADAIKLGTKFVEIGKKLGMKIQILASTGDEPIGNGIGPVLEAIDAMKVLKNDKDAPQDLRKKGLEMAGMVLELCGKAKKGEGEKMAEKTLNSGAAYKQMMRIIKAQGENKHKLRLGKFKKEIIAQKTGKIVETSNGMIAHIARSAGSPKDPYAGVYLYKKDGENVKKGDKLYTIYSDLKEGLEYAEHYDLNSVYKIK